jgi:S-adenosylmethionine-dependent methyltransferase
MSGISFDSRALKLEKNVYETLKGKIRLQLLQRDLEEYCPVFREGALRTLDVGGGSGRFARQCSALGHDVVLCDSSEEMMKLANKASESGEGRGRIRFLKSDFLSDECCFKDAFDLVIMHGSAEWMEDPEKAILKACSCVQPGGYVSLMVFNRDRSILKRGINGLLLDTERGTTANKLTPPGARSAREIIQLLGAMPGEILLQSGIRVFHNFFRQFDENVLSPEQWLEQEMMYYRNEPFSSLGEHTHFIWRAGISG